MPIRTKAFEIQYTACGSVERVSSLNKLLDSSATASREGNGFKLYVIVMLEGSEKRISLDQDEMFWHEDVDQSYPFGFED